jgi:MraZ protein
MVSSGESEVSTVTDEAQVDVHAPATFCGTYRHRIDDKGRVAIPAPLRRFLPEGSVVAPGPDHRLMIWPPAEWNVQKDLFRRTAETPAQERRFLRWFTGNSALFEVDTQGRMLLSAQQRSFATIVDEVVFVGLDTGVEIVAGALWQSEQTALSPDEFTQVWDLVHQGGVPVSSSPA